jgi:uncharacterized protein with HEPN domain
MRLEARKYLTDIEAASERIARFTDGRRFDQKIIGFRNILIHGYAAVDDRLVWGVVENHLNPLKKAVGALLATP